MEACFHDQKPGWRLKAVWGREGTGSHGLKSNCAKGESALFAVTASVSTDVSFVPPLGQWWLSAEEIEGCEVKALHYQPLTAQLDK